MLKERRDWVNEYKRMNPNKLPEDLTAFHNRHNVETPLTPEEEAERAAAEEETAGKDGKKKKEAPKKKADPKKKKGKGGEDGDSAATVKLYLSEVVKKFDVMYDDYNDTWVNRDETENYKQEYDVEMAK
jgi:hypothetical protein